MGSVDAKCGRSLEAFEAHASLSLRDAPHNRNLMNKNDLFLSHFTCLSLSFPISEMGIMMPPQGSGKNSANWSSAPRKCDTRYPCPVWDSYIRRLPGKVIRLGIHRAQMVEDRFFIHLDSLTASYTTGCIPTDTWLSSYLFTHLPFYKPGNCERRNPIRWGSQRWGRKSRLRCPSVFPVVLRSAFL